MPPLPFGNGYNFGTVRLQILKSYGDSRVKFTLHCVTSFHFWTMKLQILKSWLQIVKHLKKLSYKLFDSCDEVERLNPLVIYIL